jgi:DNA-binding PadR family transcriptional regulator
MGPSRKVSNPLALAVMGYLYQRPMHPYEAASLMREHHKHEAIRLNYGALYKVVEALVREGLIVPVETVQEGRRPERTVYALTEAGHAEYLSWLRELLREPVKEYTRFAAGLAFVAALPPAEAVALLEERARLLEEEVDEKRSALDALMESGLPEFLLVESEHELALWEAELLWVRRLVRRIEGGTLGGIEQWGAFHSEAREAGARRRDEEEAG